MALVSIIVPSYNSERWIGETLESAFAQTWPDKEVIVVDDGSTDHSLAAARAFESRGAKVLSQPNRGAAAARNAGLAAAGGAYVQFLDADDLLAPDKIATQMERLGRAGPRSVASGSWARFSSRVSEADFATEPPWKDMDGREFLTLHFEGGWMMHPAAWLCPRAVLDAAGPWDERLTLDDDGEYFGRAVLASSGILFCGAARSYYRSGLPGSLSKRSDRRSLESLWRSTELTLGRLLAAAPGDMRVRAAAAHGWMLLAFECHPAAPDLSLAAERRSRELGGSALPLPLGRRLRLASRLIGWRAAKRIHRLWHAR